MNTKEAIKRLQESAKNNNPAPRDAQLLTEGDVARQGDILFHVVPQDWPKGDKVLDTKLAPGTSKGSNHVLTAESEIYKGVKLPAIWHSTMSEAYNNEDISTDSLEKEAIGPVFVVKEDGPSGHPEHSDFIFKAGAVIQTSHQINSRTLSKVQD